MILVKIGHSKLELNFDSIWNCITPWKIEEEEKKIKRKISSR